MSNFTHKEDYVKFSMFGIFAALTIRCLHKPAGRDILVFASKCSTPAFSLAER